MIFVMCVSLRTETEEKCEKADKQFEQFAEDGATQDVGDNKDYYETIYAFQTRNQEEKIKEWITKAIEDGLIIEADVDIIE